MHDFFTPQEDRRLGSQLRREALAARPQAEHLPEKISLAVRSDPASASHRDSHQRVSTATIVYALAAMLCVALALPALWQLFTPAPPLQQAKPDTLVMVDPGLEQQEPTQDVLKPVEPTVASQTEPPIASQPEPTEDDLALLTADVQAALDTLLAVLPVDVDVDALVP